MNKAPATIETMSDAIYEIAKSARALRQTRLRDETLIQLIQWGIPVKDRPTLKQIALVLDACENLDRENLK